MVIGDLGFYEETRNGFLVRYFPKEIDDDLLYWHRDKRDRLVFVLCGKDWKIQFDNELPIYLLQNIVYPIEKEKYHRLIKGSSELILKIKEF